MSCFRCLIFGFFFVSRRFTRYEFEWLTDRFEHWLRRYWTFPSAFSIVLVVATFSEAYWFFSRCSAREQSLTLCFPHRARAATWSTMSRAHVRQGNATLDARHRIGEQGTSHLRLRSLLLVTWRIPTAGRRLLHAWPRAWAGCHLLWPGNSYSLQ